MIRIVTAAVVLGCTSGVLIAPTAQARDGDRREARISGSCSMGGRWDLKAETRDRDTEVKFEVDSSRRGQRWRYTVSHNGAPLMTGTSRTRGASGSFSVERRTTAAGASQTITAWAQNSRTGEVCLGTLRL